MPRSVKSLSIKNWAPEERPREKMLMHRPGILNNAELVALLIGSGHKEASALDLAKEILHAFNNDLLSIAQKTPQELCGKFRGIGEAKAVSILAGLELGKRFISSPPQEKPQITSSKAAFEIFRIDLINKPYESFQILLLSRSNRLLRKILISEGGINETGADPKKIFKFALDEHCSHIILGHNHPSGNVMPSQEDILATQKICAAGKLLDIGVLDHLILGESSAYYSFSDQQQAPFTIHKTKARFMQNERSFQGY